MPRRRESRALSKVSWRIALQIRGVPDSSRVNEGTGAVDVYETASHGVKKTKKRLLFFSSECLEKLYLFV